MPTIWIPGDVLHGIGTARAAEFFDAVEAAGTDGQGRLARGQSGLLGLVATQLLDGVAAILAAYVDGQAVDEYAPGWRSVVIPSYVLAELSSDDDRRALYDRLRDASNIDEAQQRAGLKFLRQKQVSTIFIAGGYRRLHMAIAEPEHVTILGVFDADMWTTHAKSSKVVQPSVTELAAWRRLHELAVATRSRLRPTLSDGTRPGATTPLVDTWIAVNQLRELGLKDDDTIRKVLACTTEVHLESVIGDVTDEQFDRIDSSFSRFRAAELRHAENGLNPIEVLALQGTTRPDRTARTFEEWLDILSPSQEKIVSLDREVPIRVKGGPGTGKTLTAMLRAGYLLRRARQRGMSLRVGFLVFNPDLGRDIYEEMVRIGLAEFLDPASPQRVTVSSLQQWCERFIDVDKLGVEPIAPYRAGGTEKNRRALLELALEEARRRLAGYEYETLWKEFDTRSKAGVREIETEISQFIKARDVADLQTYLAERRPANWWMSNTDRTFRKFVWEIYKIYEAALQQLGMIDSDDLINDSLKEVTKSVWQQFQKANVAFDYLILDEAQDFFRHQLTLVRHLVKRPEGLMICYDEAQAVYSRYPTLRDIGFDTDSAFEGLRLEENFRSTKQIVQAIRSVAAKYPTCHLADHWGDFSGGPKARDGARPIGFGFATEAAMFQQAGDLVDSALAKGIPPKEVAVIAFNDEILPRLTSTLVKRGVKATIIGGEARRPARGSVNLVTAKHVKGMQFETCLVVGADRDHLPDFEGVKTEYQREVKMEDDLRLFLVAVSRCKTELFLLWNGSEPSQFVTAMGTAIDVRG
ncbi:MAG: UvrD-helicase domain-containing protein [Kofleriaceae bacterium]|nr:UvrD-helicase domain-containing protein [Kofleriaceae bacterium]MBP9172462.1 UvrD-helicase domain-containing protein [Kofleriaceae bacterium]MBP9862806.1 UvrD-helicase domain-containing protein [Kofleriaceae bacterium]